MSCPETGRCGLYARLRASSSLAVWQTLFCNSGFHRCVRYRMSMSNALVPIDLLPDGLTRLPATLRGASGQHAA
jgi:hypothetical protein